MANVNAPFGFRPVKSATGGAHIAVNYYKVASGALRIGKGDLLNLVNDGTVARETSATAVGPWIGVSMIDTGGVAAPSLFIPVCDDPGAIYEVQASTAAIAQTDFNTIVKANCSTVPSSSLGFSKNVLTATAASQSNGVRLLRLANRSDNALGASCVVEVKLNATNSSPGTAGV